MPRKAIKWIRVVVLLLVILLIVTCPDDDDYNEWLADRHGITCVWDGSARKCNKNGVEIKFKSSHIQSAVVYMKGENTFTVRNERYDIKAIGILNQFYDFSTYSIYD